MSHVHSFLSVTAFLLFATHLGIADSKSQSATPAILAEQFETVFHAKAAFVENSGPYKGLSTRTANSLRVPFSDLLGGLQPLGNRAFREVFGDADSVSVGARNFRSPHGLGAVQAQFCFVVTLRDGSHFDLSNIARYSSSISFVGDGVWTWQVNPTEGQPEVQKYFAIQSSRSYLLVSNDIAILRAIMKELESVDRKALQPRSVITGPQNLRDYDLWGYRRYRHGDVHDKGAAGLSDVTSTAKSLLFIVDAVEKNTVLCLSASDGSTAKKMNASGKLPRLKPVRAGSWKGRLVLADNDASVERVLAVMSLFGFGIYL